MEQELVLNEEDVSRLKQFHEAHFPGQRIPSLESLNHAATSRSDPVNADESLGHYEDGVKRTLTDDQIAMFRNSEIQRIMQDRSKEAERKDEQHRKREKKRDSSDTRPAGSKTWTKHFDEASASIDTLAYDDEPNEKPPQRTGPGTFLWPKLG